jgi:hypothetical protein
VCCVLSQGEMLGRGFSEFEWINCCQHHIARLVQMFFEGSANNDLSCMFYLSFFRGFSMTDGDLLRLLWIFLHVQTFLLHWFIQNDAPLF